MKILTYPNEILDRVSDPVVEFNDTLSKLTSDMKTAMMEAGGIGLAAPQVGINKRVIIVMMPGGAIEMINPEITYKSNTISTRNEGCLSFPGEIVPVKRPEIVVVKYYTVQGHLRSLVCNGIISTCVQHEIDHLNGKVFKNT